MSAAAPYFPPEVQAWQSFVWLLLTIAIFLAWWSFFASFCRESLSLSERFLAALLSRIAQIVGTTILLDIFHMIGWWQLGILNWIIVGLLVGYQVKKKPDWWIRQEIPEFFR